VGLGPEGLRGFQVQAFMRPKVIVFDSPVLEDHPGFRQPPELFAIQAFFPEPAMEAFNVPVLPRASRFEVQRLDAGLLERAFDELRAIVATDELRGPCNSISRSTWARMSRARIRRAPPGSGLFAGLQHGLGTLRH